MSMSTYSAFFSSGLLAPQHHTSFYRSHQYGRSTNDDSDIQTTPPTPSYPLPDSDIELDTDREITPTPHMIQPTASPSAAPRLRKRRSSITAGTSPMSSIRSPSRNAGAALQLQKHLSSPSRSRSGSLGAVGHGNIASESTSLIGRIRSGSLSQVQPVQRSRRGLNRNRLMMAIPAAAPPPDAPLPALPPTQLLPSMAPGNWFQSGSLAASLSGKDLVGAYEGATRSPLVERPLSSAERLTQQQVFKGRDRSFSLSSVDEEMKEN